MVLELMSKKPLTVKMEFMVGVESGAYGVDKASIRLLATADVVKAGVTRRMEGEALDFDYRENSTFRWPDSRGEIKGMIRFIGSARDTTGYVLGDTLDVEVLEVVEDGPGG